MGGVGRQSARWHSVRHRNVPSPDHPTARDRSGLDTRPRVRDDSPGRGATRAGRRCVRESASARRAGATPAVRHHPRIERATGRALPRPRCRAGRDSSGRSAVPRPRTMSTPPFDRQRFLYSLTGALRSGEWALVGLRASFSRATAEHPIRVPGLFDRLLARFPAQPDFALLTLFLTDDPGVARALARRERGLTVGRRKAGRPAMSPPPWLGPAAVPALATADQLAAWLGVEVGRLEWLADVSGRNRTHPSGPLRLYRYRWVPKVHGRTRLLEIPRLPLKNIQRAILEQILNVITPHPAAHGFRTGHSAVTNAAAHCGRAVVVNRPRGLLPVGPGGARLPHLPLRRLPRDGRAVADGALHDKDAGGHLGRAAAPRSRRLRTRDAAAAVGPAPAARRADVAGAREPRSAPARPPARRARGPARRQLHPVRGRPHVLGRPRPRATGEAARARSRWSPGRRGSR
ncbi:RNA-directed DNA polymerase from retron Mx65 OS=Janthinobacterium sp. HH01 GN=Jab_2c01100 PE=4 SV=1 [Gemmataceae bacterium]|nr:RNA-directed DNA polymerase from retron Mx65 OS=Janthinobacterium sp. HH01 GN=Jab_2c01100 PE=4 SV=1 [Gemmataceae bacterium]VTU01620.1 RNA-directed DNA polymerase from retron Mx65 OS=Janthinobacterium sp. HH01 GN=Jab_2c01100 PE=4 SV=1 [Gemmataceae bacterium]